MFRERDEEQLLSIDEACERLMMSPGTLYKLLRSGEIKGFRVGSWKIPSSSISDYIKKKCK